MAEVRRWEGASDRIMMSQEKEELTLENVRYLKIAISLALGSDDIRNMPKTKAALNALYDKIERIYHAEDRGE